MFTQLSLESLKELDAGRVSVAFALELKRAVADCMDRPGEKKARVVTLQVRVRPEVGEGGECESGKASFSMKSSVPDRKSKEYDFGINKKGHLFFKPDDEAPARPAVEGQITREVKEP